jgi:hypothetical protein
MTKEEYHRALNNIAGTFGTLKDQVNQAFEIGRALGLGDMQIGSDVRDRIKGLVSISTIQRMLPETAKHMKHASEPIKLNGSTKVQKLHNQRRLVVPEEPTIPPPIEIHKQAEIIREPSKPITDKQTFILDPKTCKGWPCDKVYIYEVECKDGVAIRMYSI